jgi:hypothetical protein
MEKFDKALEEALKEALGNKQQGFYSDLDQLQLVDVINIPFKILEIYLQNTKYGEMIKMLIEGQEGYKGVLRTSSQTIIKQVKVLADKGLIPTQTYLRIVPVKGNKTTYYVLKVFEK